MASQEENLVFGEAPVQTDIYNARGESTEYILGVAETIFKRIGSSGVRADDEKGNEQLLTNMQAEFKDFQNSFPVMMRWMVQMREFRSRAFKRFLVKYAQAITKGLKNRDEFLELQAESIVILQKELNPRHAEEHWQAYRASIIDTLKKESEQFDAMQKEAREEVSRIDKDADQERRQILHAQLVRQKVEKEKNAKRV